MAKTNTALYAQAVDEWAHKHLIDEHEDHTFGRELKALLRGIFLGARPLLKMYKIGLALRLAFSLFTSYGDVATDALMTVQMFQRGRPELGQFSLIAMGAHIAFQIALVFSYGPTDVKARAWEVFLVIFQLKPAFDSYRVLFDSPVEGGQRVPHAETLAASRGCEVFCESFPESILQITFLIDNPREASALNLASVTFSFLSMGFGVASASVDIDLAIGNR